MFTKASGLGWEVVGRLRDSLRRRKNSSAVRSACSRKLCCPNWTVRSAMRISYFVTNSSGMCAVLSVTNPIRAIARTPPQRRLVDQQGERQPEQGAEAGEARAAQAGAPQPASQPDRAPVFSVANSAGF